MEIVVKSTYKAHCYTEQITQYSKRHFEDPLVSKYKTEMKDTTDV